MRLREAYSVNERPVRGRKRKALATDVSLREGRWRLCYRSSSPFSVLRAAAMGSEYPWAAGGRAWPWWGQGGEPLMPSGEGGREGEAGARSRRHPRPGLGRLSELNAGWGEESEMAAE